MKFKEVNDYIHKIGFNLHVPRTPKLGLSNMKV